MKIIDFLLRQYYKYIKIPFYQAHLKNIKILSSIDSINFIISKRCSVSRFGDGEFDVLMGNNGNTFQIANKELAYKLKHVLISNDASNHYIGIPYTLKNTSGLRKLSRDFWGYYTLHNIMNLLPFLSSTKTYLDTQLSRFYIMYKKKSHCEHQINILKQIWNKQDVLIIEGTESRTGVGNDLYDNTRSIKRILGPATNAFDKYDEMLDAIIKYAKKEQLILLSYGMCATCLAYDLAKLGYWAIDIGHLDIEYEWYRLGVTENKPIAGKFTNEAGTDGREGIEDCNDKEYLNQIICNIA